jgi:hypothetical protein
MFGYRPARLSGKIFASAGKTVQRNLSLMFLKGMGNNESGVLIPSLN